METRKMSFEEFKKSVATNLRTADHEQALTSQGQERVMAANNLRQLLAAVSDDDIVVMGRLLQCVVDLPEQEIAEWEDDAENALQW